MKSLWLGYVLCYMLIVPAHARLKPEVMRDRVRRGRRKEKKEGGRREEIKGSGRGICRGAWGPYLLLHCWIQSSSMSQSLVSFATSGPAWAVLVSSQAPHGSSSVSGGTESLSSLIFRINLRLASLQGTHCHLSGPN